MLSRIFCLPSLLHWRLLSTYRNKNPAQSTPSATESIKSSQTLSSVEEKLDATVNQNQIDYSHLKYPSKIPSNPIAITNAFNKSLTSTTTVDSKTLQLLERLSLVDLECREALKNLEDSIEFAERVVSICTKDVRPMYTVLEDYPLTTRPDLVTDGNIKDDILKNARLTEEDYFVAPPGNIPLEQTEKKFD